MVWGCISASGVGDIFCIDGIVNVEKYRQIPIEHAIPSEKCLIGNCFIVQHDNDPKHTAHAVKSYLERTTTDRNLKVMDCPLQSSDLNIVEAVWDHFDRRRHRRQPNSTTEFWEVLKKTSYNIPDDYLRKLQGSLPK